MTDEVTICPGVEKVGWGGRNFTSRILEGLMARRGLVEPCEAVGCWVSGNWPVLMMAQTSVLMAYRL
jgi:hypothetical protein